MQWSTVWRFVATVVMAALAAQTAACDDGGAPAGADATPGPPDAGTCIPGPDAGPAGAAGDVTGTWAVVQLSTAVVTALNSTQVSRNVSLYVMTQTGTDVAITEQLCEIKVDDTAGLVRTRMLPKMAPSVPPLTRTATMAPDGAGGFDFVNAQAWTTRGITLANIETDVMPTMASDPRIGDWDDDDHPGITLILDGVIRGDAYVIQRDWNMHTCTQLDADHIQGLAAWDSEQIYLGSDPASIAELDAMADPDPDPTKHPISFVRIPQGSNCAYVLANQCQLFGGK